MTMQSELKSMRKHAREAMNRGDFRAARSLLRYVLHRDPDDAGARAILARLGPQPKPGPNPVSVQQKAERAPRWGFRNLSLVGALALLLVLVVALLVPDGVTMATNDGGGIAAPAFAARAAVSAAAIQAAPAVPAEGTDCITGRVVDQTGQPAGEGWAVEIMSAGGEHDSTYVSASGTFFFTDEPLALEEWSVELGLPVGWRTLTENPYPATLIGAGAGGCAYVEFRVEALPCLCVYKRDKDNPVGFPSGIGLPDWQFFAKYGDVTLTEKTDGTGEACFYNLEAGDWTVTEESKEGWKPAAGYPSEQTVTLVSPRTPGECQWLEFVNEQCTTGSIRVCKQDPSGNPLANWQFSLYAGQVTVPPFQPPPPPLPAPVQTLRTDASGCVTFDGGLVGWFTVVDDGLRGSQHPWLPQNVDWWKEIGDRWRWTYVAPCVQVDVSFVNEPLGCIEVCKIDEEGNRIPGWDIAAVNLTTGEQFNGVTNKTGCYNFHVPLGSYTISETLPINCEAITPSYIRVDVTEAFVCEHVIFKNKCEDKCGDKDHDRCWEPPKDWDKPRKDGKG